MIYRTSDYLKQHTTSNLTAFARCCLRVQLTVQLAVKFQGQLAGVLSSVRAPKPHCKLQVAILIPSFSKIIGSIILGVLTVLEKASCKSAQRRILTCK